MCVRTFRAPDIASLFDKQRESMEAGGTAALMKGAFAGAGGSLGFGFRGSIPKLPSFKRKTLPKKDRRKSDGESSDDDDDRRDRHHRDRRRHHHQGSSSSTSKRREQVSDIATCKLLTTHSISRFFRSDEERKGSKSGTKRTGLRKGQDSRGKSLLLLRRQRSPLRLR